MLVVMHRRTLYENVDSAEIKVPFYGYRYLQVCVASMHRIIIHCIRLSDETLNRGPDSLWSLKIPWDIS